MMNEDLEQVAIGAGAGISLLMIKNFFGIIKKTFNYIKATQLKLIWQKIETTIDLKFDLKLKDALDPITIEIQAIKKQLHETKTIQQSVQIENLRNIEKQESIQLKTAETLDLIKQYMIKANG